jgi:cytochrome c-type protein NapB
LSKTSVFDTPVPEPFAYPETKPGDNATLPRAWEGSPPLIPHRIETYLPIITDNNQCLDCHDKPQDIGKTKPAKPPMSRDHYATAELKEVAGTRFTCTQCHVPRPCPPLRYTFHDGHGRWLARILRGTFLTVPAGKRNGASRWARSTPASGPTTGRAPVPAAITSAWRPAPRHHPLQPRRTACAGQPYLDFHATAAFCGACCTACP